MGVKKEYIKGFGEVEIIERGDKWLRKFLGTKETRKKDFLKKNKFQYSWITGTRGEALGEIRKIRSMAYDAIYETEAICDYLGIELKEDKNELGIYKLKAFKKCRNKS